MCCQSGYWRTKERCNESISSRRKGHEEPNHRLSTRLTEDWSKDTCSQLLGMTVRRSFTVAYYSLTVIHRNWEIPQEGRSWRTYIRWGPGNLAHISAISLHWTRDISHREKKWVILKFATELLKKMGHDKNNQAWDPVVTPNINYLSSFACYNNISKNN